MRTRLEDRISLNDIKEICIACESEPDSELKEELYSLIQDDDDRIGYNALWIMTHFMDYSRQWLNYRRDDLIDILLKQGHIGKQRLLLTILDQLSMPFTDIRTDYLDYCLQRINSTLPYGIRSLCMKQAFCQCQLYSELLDELKLELDIMMQCEISPGLLATRRKLLGKIEKLS